MEDTNGEGAGLEVAASKKVADSWKLHDGNCTGSETSEVTRLIQALPVSERK